jgi:hypothetical protein
MSSASQVEQLRARARHLRAVSGLIGASRSLTVYNLAGSDTWVGPTPHACAEALLTLRRRLQTGQLALTDAARGLDRRADVIERQPPSAGLAS